jgi:dTDP-4-amino-4,6-dideoxygalactose transaminase
MERLEKPVHVTKAFLPPINEYVEEIKKIWENHWVTNNGPIHDELESKLKEYLGVKNTTLFTNGHCAMDIAIKTLNLTGEVITTPFTFASTTHAIVMNNLTPVFCDIKMSDFTIDENKIEELITDKTSAIIPVHVFGYPCNIKKIEEIAKKYNLKVIYDAAHVFGVEVDGRGIGNFGDISMFSLHATKVYNSIEGGLLTTNDVHLQSNFNMLKNFGITGEENVEAVGLNAKMNEFQAAMGVVNLRYIDKQISKRKIVAESYRENLEKISGISYLKDIRNIKHNYSYFPIFIDETVTGVTRNEIYEKLKDYNIYTRKYFYPLITDFNCYKGIYNDEKLKKAKYIADRILTLPMYGELTKESVNKITRAINTIIINYS